MASRALHLGNPTEADLDNDMYNQNYFGPGVYKHYKGGLYIVFGLQRIEFNDADFVAYMTLDPGRQQDNYYKGYFSVGRPLHFSDGKDPFNSLVWPPPVKETFEYAPLASPIAPKPTNSVPRFRRVS